MNLKRHRCIHAQRGKSRRHRTPIDHQSSIPTLRLNHTRECRCLCLILRPQAIDLELAIHARIRQRAINANRYFTRRLCIDPRKTRMPFRQQRSIESRGFKTHGDFSLILAPLVARLVQLLRHRNLGRSTRDLTLAVEPPHITRAQHAVGNRKPRRNILISCCDPQITGRKLFRPIVIHHPTRHDVRIARVLDPQTSDIKHPLVQSFGKISRTSPRTVDHISVVSAIDEQVQHTRHAAARKTLEFKPRLILRHAFLQAEISPYTISRDFARPLIRPVPVSQKS